MPSLLSIAYHFFLQIAVILLTYRLLWPLFRRLAQVQVVAIMVAGFLLGPSVFLGWIWPAAQQWLFPPSKLAIGTTTIVHPNLTVIYVVGQLGLVLYMFLVGGSSFQLNILGAHLRQAGATAATGIGVPLALGGVLGWSMVSLGGYFTDKVVHWQGGASSWRPRWRSPPFRCWRGSCTTRDCSKKPAWAQWLCPAPPLTTRARGYFWRRWSRRRRGGRCPGGRFWLSAAAWPTWCS